MSSKNQLKSSVKYPTSLVIGGDDILAVEIVKSLIEQNGYVIVIDKDNESFREKYKDLKDNKLLTILDYSSIEFLEDDLRRLDYVFFLSHRYDHANLKLSSQEFLQYSNYLDLIINTTKKFDAKLLLTSSIKAHQIMHTVRDKMDFDKDVKEKVAVYSQMEVQRYAEALVFESIDKYSIDARVIRLGRIIGPEMEIDVQHAFDSLVMDAVMGRDLKVRSDGLDTNMYVHVLDAAYGVIKAMFTRDTKGKIYSVANEEEITDLSIAYKLQELVGLDQQIKFDNSDNEYPAIRFHKPAQSLSVIGWLPRVSFERSLVQVFDYVRDLQINEVKEKINKQTSGEVVEDSSVEVDNDSEPKGALARLIAERKAQENSRRGSILLANDKLKERTKAKRKLTQGERFSRYVRKNYDEFTHRLRFLKSITLAELFFYFLVSVVFIVFYISFLAPAFVILKDFALIEYYGLSLDRHVEEQDQVKITQDLERVSSTLEEMGSNYEKFEPIYALFAQEQSFEETSESISSLYMHLESIQEAYEINSTVYELLASSDYKLIYRPTSDSLLEIGTSSLDSGLLSSAIGSSVKAEQLDDRIEATSLSLAQKETTDVLGYDISQIRDQVDKLTQDSIGISKFVQNYSKYFLTDSQQTYAFVLQDESRYTPSGGYPAAIGYLKVREGEIVDMELQPYSAKDQYDFGKLTKEEIEAIQMASVEFVTEDEITFEDLFLVADKDLIEDNINEYFFNRYQEESQAIFFVNTSLLSGLIANTGDIEINQVNIDANSINSSLEILVGEKGLDERNRVIANIAALEIVELAEDPTLLFLLAKNSFGIDSSKDIQIVSTNNQIERDLLGEVSIDEGASELDIFHIIDSNVVLPDQLTQVNIAIEDNFMTFDQVQRIVRLDYQDVEDIERSVVCIPVDAEIEETSTEMGRSILGERMCLSANIKQGDELIVKYSYSPTIENIGGNEYNIKLLFANPPGIRMNYDYDASASGFVFIPSDDYVISGDSIFASGQITSEEIINIKLRK